MFYFFSSALISDDGVCPGVNNYNFSHVTLTPNNVCDALRCLRATTSTGPDDIPNILLKTLCGQLALPLSHIFDYLSIHSKFLMAGSMIC